MNLSVSVSISSNNISVQIPDWDLSKNVLPRVAHHPEGKKIIAIGQDAVKLNNLIEFDERGEQVVQIIDPFDIRDFRPRLAVMMLVYIVATLCDEITRRSIVKIITSVWLDNFDYDMQIEDYDSLPPELRHEFEGMMQRHASARKLIINGQQRGWPKRQWRFASWTLTILLLLIWITPFLIMAVFLWKLRYGIEKGYAVLSIIIWMILGEAIVDAIWLLALRDYLPHTILSMTLLEGRGITSIKFWLAKRLL